MDTGRRGIVSAAIGRLGPVVLREIDMNAVVAELDVDAIASRLDLDAIIARLDMDAIVERLDVDAIAARLDLDTLLARLDMDAIVERLDVDAIAARLDLDTLLARLDMDAIVERLDVDAIAARLDLDTLVGRLDKAQLTADATQDVALSGLDLVRRQLVRADRTIEAAADRLVGRGPGSRPDAPGELDLTIPVAVEHRVPGPDAAGVAPRRKTVSGHYAGPLTRMLALAGDTIVALGSYGFVGATTLYLLSTITGVTLTLGSGGWLNPVLLGLWLLLWFWWPVTYFGRTPAMALLGIAVVGRDGGIVRGRRALVRALILPLSIGLLGAGLLGMVFGRERRALHDAAAGTVEVYDWGSREAEQPVTIREQLQARVRRRRAPSTETGRPDPT